MPRKQPVCRRCWWVTAAPAPPPGTILQALEAWGTGGEKQKYVPRGREGNVTSAFIKADPPENTRPGARPGEACLLQS